jgi:hypothetical protein
MEKEMMPLSMTRKFKKMKRKYFGIAPDLKSEQDLFTLFEEAEKYRSAEKRQTFLDKRKRAIPLPLIGYR